MIQKQRTTVTTPTMRSYLIQVIMLTMSFRFTVEAAPSKKIRR